MYVSMFVMYVHTNIHTCIPAQIDNEFSGTDLVYEHRHSPCTYIQDVGCVLMYVSMYKHTYVHSYVCTYPHNVNVRKRALTFQIR